MKKFFATLIVLLMMSVQVEAITCEDSTFAIETINQKLREWNKYMNELAEGHGFEKKFTACMVFYTDFISPPDDGKISAWNYDSEYKNYSWYFGLYEDGTWKLLTWGY